MSEPFKEVEPLPWQTARNMKTAELVDYGRGPEVQIHVTRHNYAGARALRDWLNKALGDKP